MSLWNNGKNITGDENSLTKEGSNFIGGILKYLPALSHFLAPSPNSLKRIVPDMAVGNANVWGIENKFAPIRVIAPIMPGDIYSHFELKILDHTAN